MFLLFFRLFWKLVKSPWENLIREGWSLSPTNFSIFFIRHWLEQLFQCFSVLLGQLQRATPGGSWNQLLYSISVWCWCVLQLSSTDHFEPSWWMDQALLCAGLWTTGDTKCSQCVDLQRRLSGYEQDVLSWWKESFFPEFQNLFSHSNFPFNCFFFLFFSLSVSDELSFLF